MMNKEKEALLKAVREAVKKPIHISEKSILRMIERMKPETEDMRAYILAYFSAPTEQERQAIMKAKYDSMSPAEIKAFDDAYLRCVENDLKDFRQAQTIA